MDVSLIFVNYNSKNLIRQNLEALLGWNGTLPKEVIVVDNARESGLRAIVAKSAKQVCRECKIQYIGTKKNKGFAKGVNVGMKQAHAKYVLILNPDIVLVEKPLERLYNKMEQQASIGIMGPRLIQPDGQLQFSGFALPTFLNPLYRRTTLRKTAHGKKVLNKFLLKDKMTSGKEEKVDWIQGSCMMVRRQAAREVGKMDEKFFMYFEDIDWCRRFLLARWDIVYYPEATFVHYFNRWSAQYHGVQALLRKATWIHIQSWLYYFYKWHKITKNSRTVS